MQGEKQAKTGKNRSKSASNSVDRIFEKGWCGLFGQNGEKKSAIYDTEQQSLREIPTSFIKLIIKSELYIIETLSSSFLSSSHKTVDYYMIMC